MSKLERIILLRHGQTDANRANLVCGHLDFDLNEIGVEQARSIKNMFSHFNNIETIAFCSPLKRAMQTIVEILPNTIKFRTSENIKEINTGLYSNLNYDELYLKESRFKHWGKNPNLEYPSGESLLMASERAHMFLLKELFESQKSQCIVVSHSGMINLLLHHILGTQIEFFPQFSIEHCAAIVLVLQDEIWRLQSFNLKSGVIK